MTRCWSHGTIGSLSILYSYRAVSHAAMWAPGENRCSLPGATDDHRTFADLCTACIRADGGDQCIEEREGVSHQHRYYRGRPISVGFVSDGRRSGLDTLSSWEGGEEIHFANNAQVLWLLVSQRLSLFWFSEWLNNTFFGLGRMTTDGPSQQVSTFTAIIDYNRD